MRKLKNILERNYNKLTGRKASFQEQSLLKSSFSKFKTISELNETLIHFPIIDQVFEIKANDDRSGFGVEMRFFSPSEQVEEAFEFYPGIVALKKGFLPLGSCLKGSGDPYFLTIKNDVFDIFRIPHDSVDGNGSLIIDCLEYVNTFEFFLENLPTDPAAPDILSQPLI